MIGEIKMEPRLLNFTPDMPRTDYPRPQWMREDWLCLNGQWEFAIDHGNSGTDRKMFISGDYPLSITVPFCPESELSGVVYKDFMAGVWYRKNINLEKTAGKRYILNFGAVDYLCQVWVNGVFCGKHEGGYCSFFFDITSVLKDGENTIVVNAQDELVFPDRPTGKQCRVYESYGTRYTRTTGIWQTVWIDIVPDKYMVRSKMLPSAKDCTLTAEITGIGTESGDNVMLTAFYDGRKVGESCATFSGDHAVAQLKLSEEHLWNVLAPELYDLEIKLISNGEVIDTVYSYFGLRDVALTDRYLTVNGKPVFMRTVLDQGYNPKGIYTGPSDEFLKKDIELAIDLGFNGARLHQRIFEERTLYWADRLGYLVWDEYPWGNDLGSVSGLRTIIPEWTDLMHRDFNHPALIGWCPLNETYHLMALDEDTHRLLYRISKAIDPTRPVIDASGGMHYDTDMFDVHDYEDDPEVFRNYFEPMKNDPKAFHCPIPRYVGNAPRRPIEYKGQPYWVSEYGGILWNPKAHPNDKIWGYGKNPKTEEEFIVRYEKLTKVLLEHPRICGFSYTQLTDIEFEQNGLYFYDRSPKFSKDVYDRIRAVNRLAAYIETETEDK